MSKEPVVASGQLLSTKTLGALDLFRGEEPKSLDWVINSCRLRSLVPGELLLAPDRDNDALYVILAGRAEVRFTHDDPCSRVFLESGECAGEMSIIEGRRPSATVTACSHCLALTIDADLVWALIDRSPVVARNLLHILSTRVRRNNLALVQSQAQQRVHERDALNDSLTGLYNRRWMESTLVRIVERSAQLRESLALLMIDTDHFKCYNDQHGHLSGDQLLTGIARAIAESVRSSDYCCRYGGDEFVVVLPQAGPTEALQIAERVCRSVRKQTRHAGDGGFEGPASVSVGIASLGPGMNVRQLLASADAALYRAKAAGRDRACQ
jgi:diguanylate cyclase (GGDEF)-like protein